MSRRCAACCALCALRCVPRCPEAIARAAIMLLLALSALPTNASSSVDCDFPLPAFRISSSLSKSVYYPPLPVLSAEARYSWTCRPPSDSRGFPFNVLLSANVPVAGMLALAFQENTSVSADVILTDFLDDDFEWGVPAHAVLSNVAGNSFSPPTLLLGFSADACGCVKRVRFSWYAREAAESGSCEAVISVQPDTGNIDNSCFPSWAFDSSFDSKTDSPPEKSALHFLVDLPSSNPCYPAPFNALTWSHKALRTVSFNGRCK
jgi:hypothetical protein